MRQPRFLKIVLTLLLSLALLFTLCACGQTGGGSSSTPGANVSSDIGAPPTVSPRFTPADSTQASAPISEPVQSVAPSTAPPSSAAAPSSTAPLGAIKSVLLGETEFFSADANKNLKISQLNQVIFPANPELTPNVISFSVIDIGYTATSAVVLQLNLYGVVVLSYQDGVVYGYTFAARQFDELRTDGAFESSGGAGDVGINTITFDKSTYSIDKFTYCETNSDSTESYFVNHQSATEDAFNAAFSRWQQVPYVTWYDFTPANIDAILS